MKRVAINGMGRVGHLIFRQFLKANHDDIELVAVNDIIDPENLAYLVKYDSAHGRLEEDVSVAPGELRVGDKTFKLCHESNPENLDWKGMEIDVVIECSGKFRTRDSAAQHISAGARRVLMSAPPKDEVDKIFVYGFNDHEFDPERHFIMSNASCTTNSLVPPLKLLLDEYGIEHALVTTIHAYTVSQGMVDTAKSDMIRGRAGAVNIIPTSTGADVTTIALLPELDQRLSAIAVRVPVVNGSLTDISVTLKKGTSVDEINAFFRAASKDKMKSVLGYTDDPIVSTDILGDPRSGIVHGLSTRVIQDRLLKLHVWYDNEYAYARRCLDLIQTMPFHH